MIDKQELISALKKADTAGNVEDAKRLSDALRRLDSGPQEEGMTTGEAGAIGLGQGLSAGLKDEATAILETGKQVFEDTAAGYIKQGLSGAVDAFPNVSETYNTNVEIERDKYREAAEKHPVAYYTGDVAGTIASTAATFGVATKFRYGKMALKTASGLLSTLGAIDLVHGMGRSEDETIEGVVKEGFESSVMGAAGGVIGKAAGPILKYGGEKLQKISTNSFFRYLGVRASDMKATLKKVGKDGEEWASRVLNMTDEQGTPLIKATSKRIDLLDTFIDQKGKAWNGMKSVLSEVDEGGAKNIDAESIYDDIVDTVLDPLRNSIDPDDIKIAAKLDKNIKASLFKAPDIDPKTGMGKGIRQPNENLTLANLHSFNSRIFKDAKIVKKSGDSLLVRTQRAKEEMAHRLHGHIDDVVEKTDTLKNTPLKSKWDQARLKYGDLKEAEKAIEASIKDNGGDYLRSIMGDSIFRYSSVAGIILQQTESVSTGAVALGIAGLRGIQKAPLTNGLIARSAGRIADSFTKNPDKYNKMAGQLVSSIGISTEAFMDTLNVTAAEIELMENPIPRSSEEVIKRKDAILTVLENKDAKVASSLRGAIEKENPVAISAIMSELATQDVNKRIQPGIGWDGVAYSDQDKALVLETVNKIKNTRKRMHLKSQFLKDSAIPQDILEGGDGQEPDKFFNYEKARKGPSDNKF